MPQCSWNGRRSGRRQVCPFVLFTAALPLRHRERSAGGQSPAFAGGLANRRLKRLWLQQAVGFFLLAV